MECTRRQAIGLGLSSLLWAGCNRIPFVSKVYEMFQNNPYYFEKKIRNEKLKLNTSRYLRRYKGLEGDPFTRESELVKLARREKYEESFVFVLPEKVWYEVGIQFKNDAKVPDHDESGHTHKGNGEYASRTIDLLMHYFSGNFGSLPKADIMHFYHYHPMYLVAKNVFQVANKIKLKPGQTLEDFAYNACTKPNPPSLGDLYIGGDIFKTRAKVFGIKFLEHVADVSGVWDFGFSKTYDDMINKTKDLKKFFRPLSVAYQLSHRQMFFDRDMDTAEKFIALVRNNLKKCGLSGDEIKLRYREINHFKPSRRKFREFLRQKRLMIN